MMPSWLVLLDFIEHLCVLIIDIFLKSRKMVFNMIFEGVKLAIYCGIDCIEEGFHLMKRRIKSFFHFLVSSCHICLVF